MANILYISYDGMLEPLGQSQVASYLKILTSQHNVYLISFEKKSDLKNIKRLNYFKDDFLAHGVQWSPYVYHKRLSIISTILDVLVAIFAGSLLIRKEKIQIVHSRSYVPAISALFFKNFFNIKFIFDIRGFWVDERIEGGIWRSNGLLHKMAKNIEKRFFLSADHIVLLTNAASKIISEFSYLNGKHPPMSIIPTCVDLSHFKKNFNNGTKKEFIVGYVGSVGTWYLFDEVLRSFKMLLTIKPNATMLVVNRKENSYINERMTALSVDKSKVKVISAEYADMPDLLSKISLGIFFYKPSYSRNACSPTKLGEFLAMGIPCLSNVGVGDILKILEGDEVGVVIENFSNDSMKDGLNKVLNLCEAKDIERRCRNISEKYYSLSDGAKVYDDIYKSLENI